MEWSEKSNVDAVEIESVMNLRKVYNFLKEKDTSGWYVFEEVFFKRIEKGYMMYYQSEPTKVDVDYAFDGFLNCLRRRKDEMTFDL